MSTRDASGTTMPTHNDHKAHHKRIVMAPQTHACTHLVFAVLLLMNKTGLERNNNSNKDVERGGEGKTRACLHVKVNRGNKS